ncbi:hypothetical protein GCM10010294_50820 [Streptomyces griseoloalbus]|nr:hypothetical protein GCM10010294_50820 [Streptomyces griseoloalbus]
MDLRVEHGRSAAATSLLAAVAFLDAAGDIGWLVRIDSPIVRAHQYATATGRKRGTGRMDEPDAHALGRSSGPALAAGPG